MLWLTNRWPSLLIRISNSTHLAPCIEGEGQEGGGEGEGRRGDGKGREKGRGRGGCLEEVKVLPLK